MCTPQIRNILIVILLISYSGLNAQVTDMDIKLAYIYRFTEYIEWQPQKKTTPFSIGVFTDDELMLKKFSYLAKNREIKNREIRIVPIPSINNLKNLKLNILYINSLRNNQIANIFDAIKGKNTLLVTDNCPLKEAIMINFLPSEEEGIVRFEINKKNSTDEGLIIKANILLLGGSYVDIQKLFYEKEKELKKEKEKLRKSKLELKQQKELTNLQDKEITEREEILLAKNSKIRQQELKLYIRKMVLDSLSKEVGLKIALLNSKQKELTEQDNQIVAQQKNLQKTNTEIIKQKRKLNTREMLIRKQENVLIKQVSQINFQQYILYSIIFVLLLAVGLIYFIYKSLRIKKKANIKLKLYNDEILAQNEEIKSQREEIRATNESLARVNNELEKLSIVASKTNNAVIISDHNGEIEWINEGFTKLFGYQYDELVLKFGKNLAAASAHANIEEKIAECKKTKKTVEYLVLNTSKSGKKIWMHTSLTPILDNDGHIKKLIAIEANVTELKKAEQNIQLQKEEIIKQFDEIEAQRDKVKEQNVELEKHKNHLEELVKERTKQLLVAKEKAEESDRLKSAFIANMSHEIRTPLNAIVGFSQLLANSDTAKEKANEFANIINDNSNTLVHLIDDIIDLSKIEAGQLKIKKIPCELNSVFNDVFMIFNEKIRKQRPNVNFRFKNKNSEKKLIINTDKIRLKQVLINLLDNALKFTEKGSIEFSFQEKPKDKLVQIFVKDTGIGIKHTKQAVVFDRFIKIEDDKMKLYRGTGLGLSICKAIVGDLGGKIWVKSEFGKGATFYFTLPM